MKVKILKINFPHSANSWGTPVGAGTVSLGVAFFLGSIMEMLGSVYLSGEVVSSIAGAKSVVKMELYRSDNETECDHFMSGEESLMRERALMLGLVTSMVASQIWQLIATYLAWPVSGTHTIISALMGFTLMEKGGRVGAVSELEGFPTTDLIVAGHQHRQPQHFPRLGNIQSDLRPAGVSSPHSHHFLRILFDNL